MKKTLIVVKAEYTLVFQRGFGEQMEFWVVPKEINPNGDQCMEVKTEEFDKESIEFLIELGVLRELGIMKEIGT